MALQASREDVSPAGWLDATVPGLAAQDLLRHGRIPDPYWGDEVKAARWIEGRDFVYRTTFSLDEDDATRGARLTFDSLDTFAIVYLNGELVATHENQFRRLFVDVTGKLRAGANRLAIAFEASLPATVRRAGAPLPFWNEPWERLYVRKSQMSYGWDWAARTPTVGPAGSISLELSSGVAACDLSVMARPAENGSGHLCAVVELTCDRDLELQTELVVDGELLASAAATAQLGKHCTIELRATIDGVRLWMPKELGEPSLYTVEVRVRSGTQLLHEAQQRIGFRSVELVKNDANSPNGKVFYFRVNDTKLWVKGDNWLPLDFLHTRVTPAQYREYLELLQAAGVNMIRVWGGGIVEQPAFYDLCDELGLLVWQDFYFACGIYPEAPEFLAEVKLEAEDIVRRLRSHACLAIWCGNNENEALAMVTDPSKRFHPIYYEVLPEVCRTLDPARAYWPGSPASESRELHPDSDQEGDRHNWDVWFGWKTTDYITDVARFNSEFGAQSFPQRESIESFMRPDEAWSPGAVNRPEGQSPGLVLARHGAQLEKLFSRAAAFGNPVSLDAAIATTQSFQADTVGRYIRHYRSKMPLTGGVIIWNFTSTWPSVCWALIDWYRRPKQAYYECKRCFRPVTVGVAAVSEAQQAFEAHVSLDRPGEVEGVVHLELLHIESGAVVDACEVVVKLHGASATAAARLELPVGLDRQRHALVATFHHGSGVERDVRYLVPLRDLKGLGGELAARREGDTVVLTSTGWRLRVGIESYETPAIWSDNYFDMLPGESRTLHVEHGRFPAHLWLVADMGSRAPLLEGLPIRL